MNFFSHISLQRLSSGLPCVSVCACVRECMLSCGCISIFNAGQGNFKLFELLYFVCRDGVVQWNVSHSFTVFPSALRRTGAWQNGETFHSWEGFAVTMSGFLKAAYGLCHPFNGTSHKACVGLFMIFKILQYKSLAFCRIRNRNLTVKTPCLKFLIFVLYFETLSSKYTIVLRIWNSFLPQQSHSSLWLTESKAAGSQASKSTRIDLTH